VFSVEHIYSAENQTCISDVNLASPNKTNYEMLKASNTFILGTLTKRYYTTGINPGINIGFNEYAANTKNHTPA